MLRLVEKNVDPYWPEKKVHWEGAEKNKINDEIDDCLETWLCASTSGDLTRTSVVIKFG